MCDFLTYLAFLVIVCCVFILLFLLLFHFFNVAYEKSRGRAWKLFNFKFLNSGHFFSLLNDSFNKSMVFEPLLFLRLVRIDP